MPLSKHNKRRRLIQKNEEEEYSCKQWEGCLHYNSLFTTGSNNVSNII